MILLSFKLEGQENATRWKVKLNWRRKRPEVLALEEEEEEQEEEEEEGG